jgi:hypothetical protein
MSNKTQLQTNNNALEALITRVNAAKDTAASLPEAGGIELKMVEVTHGHMSMTGYLYYFNSSCELAEVSRGSTVSALGGIIMHFGHYELAVVSGDGVICNTGLAAGQVVKFTTNGGVVITA